MLSFSHLILLFLVVLLVFGPKKLPEVARTISKAMAEFHRLSGDFQETLQREMRQLEREALEESRPAPPPPLVESAAVAADPVLSSSADLTSHEASISDGANGQLTVAASGSPQAEIPQEGDTLNHADASHGAASSSEALPYYDALYDTAVASGIEWPPEASEAADTKTRESAVTTENLPGADSSQFKNPVAEQKSPAAAGAENPINDHHPTAA